MQRRHLQSSADIIKAVVQLDSCDRLWHCEIYKYYHSCLHLQEKRN